MVESIANAPYVEAKTQVIKSWTSEEVIKPNQLIENQITIPFESKYNISFKKIPDEVRQKGKDTYCKAVEAQFNPGSKLITIESTLSKNTELFLKVKYSIGVNEESDGKYLTLSFQAESDVMLELGLPPIFDVEPYNNGELHPGINLDSFFEEYVQLDYMQPTSFG